MDITNLTNNEQLYIYINVVKLNPMKSPSIPYYILTMVIQQRFNQQP